MKLAATPGRIAHSRGVIPVGYDVLDAREIGEVIVAVFDYMAFPKDKAARNLFGYSAQTNEVLWRADDIGMGSTDAYTNVISEMPLIVGNFAGFACTIDIATGQVIAEEFTK
ncbi:MAG: hypothetical protein C0483_26170 [Pirellula sp.]|nr:hypothetical protein [Pirellula sp.]